MADIEDPRSGMEPQSSEDVITLSVGGTFLDLCSVEASLLEPRAKFLETARRIPHNGLTVVHIPNSREVDNQALKCYVHFLRRGKIASLPDVAADADFIEKSNSEYKILCRAYILGTKVKDVGFQDTVMDALFCKFREADVDGRNWLPPADIIKEAYKRTKAQSQLRRFLVDTFIWAADAQMAEEASQDIPEAFFRELTVALMRRSATERSHTKIPAGTEACTYHLHEAGEQCDSKKRKRDDSSEFDTLSEGMAPGHESVQVNVPSRVPPSKTQPPPQQPPPVSTNPPSSVNGSVKRRASSTDPALQLSQMSSSRQQSPSNASRPTHLQATNIGTPTANFPPRSTLSPTAFGTQQQQTTAQPSNLSGPAMMERYANSQFTPNFRSLGNIPAYVDAWTLAPQQASAASPASQAWF